MEYEINLKDIKERIFKNENGWNNYRNVSIEEMDWLVEQAEMVQVLENKLENAIFTTYEDPEPKRTFPLIPVTLKASSSGKLPMSPERED